MEKTWLHKYRVACEAWVDADTAAEAIEIVEEYGETGVYELKVGEVFLIEDVGERPLTREERMTQGERNNQELLSMQRRTAEALERLCELIDRKLPG